MDLFCLSLIIVVSSFATVSFKNSDTDSELIKDSQALLGDNDRLQLKKNEKGGWTLMGQAERASDIQKVEKLLGSHSELKNHVRLSKAAKSHIRQRLEKTSSQMKLKGSWTEQDDGKFIFNRPASKAQMAQLQKVYPWIEAAVPPRSVSTPLQPTIFLEIALVEVLKSALSKLGLRLHTPVTASAFFAERLAPTTSTLAMLGTGDPIRSFLDLALQSGEARIHAKESVVSENGQWGEFQSGGEFPVKVSGLSSFVEFKRYGLILKFRPLLLKPPLIHLEVESEMSDIDMGSLVDGIPVILKKEIKTQVNTKLDEMIALGGIVRSSQSQFTDRIPGLSSIPGIGRLFQSKDFKNQNSEAYIFITAKKLEGPWLPTPEF